MKILLVILRNQICKDLDVIFSKRKIYLQLFQIKGKVVDISNKGQLILELPDNTRQKFIAGDVSIDKNSITF